MDNFTQQVNTIGVTPREVVNQTTTTKSLKNSELNNSRNNGGHNLSKIDFIDVDIAQPNEKKASYRIRTESAVDSSKQNNNVTSNVAVQSTTTNNPTKASLPGVRFKSDIEVFRAGEPVRFKENTPRDYYVPRTEDIVKSAIRNPGGAVNVIDVDFDVYDDRTTSRNTNANRYTSNSNADRRVASLVKIVS
jgi:hypothetical protein